MKHNPDIVAVFNFVCGSSGKSLTISQFVEISQNLLSKEKLKNVPTTADLRAAYLLINSNVDIDQFHYTWKVVKSGKAYQLAGSRSRRSSETKVNTKATIPFKL